MKIVAVDIGGTSIKSGIWDGEKITEWKEQPSYAKKGGDALIQRVQTIIKSYGTFDALGISTAGQVDVENGSIYYANENIPNYTGMKVKKILADTFRTPVFVENDVNAAALGEAQFGAGKDVADFLCLTYGTGVGGAIVINRQIYRGSRWSAGSFGGILVHPEDMTPGKEFSGCYENYASVTALIKKACQIDGSLQNGRAIFEALDRSAVFRLVDQWIGEIVYGLVTLVHVLNPSRIVLGGGIMEQPFISMEVRQRLLSLVSPGMRTTEIVRAELGNQAGFLGAAYEAEKLLRLGATGVCAQLPGR